MDEDAFALELGCASLLDFRALECRIEMALRNERVMSLSVRIPS